MSAAVGSSRYSFSSEHKIATGKRTSLNHVSKKKRLTTYPNCDQVRKSSLSGYDQVKDMVKSLCLQWSRQSSVVKETFSTCLSQREFLFSESERRKTQTGQVGVNQVAVIVLWRLPKKKKTLYIQFVCTLQPRALQVQTHLYLPLWNVVWKTRNNERGLSLLRVYHWQVKEEVFAENRRSKERVQQSGREGGQVF